MPRAVKNCMFEALGTQVGQQRAMADHLDVQSATLGAPSQPQENTEGGHIEQLVGIVFWITFGTYFWRLSTTKWVPECDPKWSTCGDG